MDEPADTLRGADDAARRMRGRARWYPSAVAAFGLVTALIVALIPVLPGTGGVPTTIGIFAFVCWATAWRYQRPVRPVSDTRVAIWVFTWLVLFIAVVWFLGPDVAHDSVPLWAVFGLVQALPPLVEAGLWWGRST